MSVRYKLVDEEFLPKAVETYGPSVPRIGEFIKIMRYQGDASVLVAERRVIEVTYEIQLTGIVDGVDSGVAITSPIVVLGAKLAPYTTETSRCYRGKGKECCSRAGEVHATAQQRDAPIHCTCHCHE